MFNIKLLLIFSFWIVIDYFIPFIISLSISFFESFFYHHFLVCPHSFEIACFYFTVTSYLVLVAFSLVFVPLIALHIIVYVFTALDFIMNRRTSARFTIFFISIYYTNVTFLFDESSFLSHYLCLSYLQTVFTLSH